VPRLEDVPPLYALLTRSATAQPITTYFNMISGPRGPGEKDGPREVHLVILDNGRTRTHADAQLRATLACIRCGACMNHCPVYTRVGGHAYEAVYPGPIGTLVTPQAEGVGQRAGLLEASSLCGACGEVCPVGIPIPELIVRLRTEAAGEGRDSAVRGRGEGRHPLDRAAWRFWAFVLRRPSLYRAASFLATRFGRFAPRRLPPLSAWTSVRAAPLPARRSLRELADREGVPDA
jgi:L-lactate dehydrogenase complex protein LldF